MDKLDCGLQSKWRFQRLIGLDQSYRGLAGYMELLALVYQIVWLQHEKERNDLTTHNKNKKIKCCVSFPSYGICPCPC